MKTEEPGRDFSNVALRPSFEATRSLLKIQLLALSCPAEPNSPWAILTHVQGEDHSATFRCRTRASPNRAQQTLEQTSTCSQRAQFS